MELKKIIKDYLFICFSMVLLLSCGGDSDQRLIVEDAKGNTIGYLVSGTPNIYTVVTEGNEMVVLLTNTGELTPCPSLVYLKNGCSGDVFSKYTGLSLGGETGSPNALLALNTICRDSKGKLYKAVNLEAEDISVAAYEGIGTDGKPKCKNYPQLKSILGQKLELANNTEVKPQYKTPLVIR